jgi:hypothetical protein
MMEPLFGGTLFDAWGIPGRRMSSILFLMAVIAFLVVVHWVFVNDGPAGKSGARGLLAMRDASDPENAPPRPPPRWARAGPLDSSAEVSVSRPQPRWRRAAQHGRWRA